VNPKSAKGRLVVLTKVMEVITLGGDCSKGQLVVVYRGWGVFASAAGLLTEPTARLLMVWSTMALRCETTSRLFSRSTSRNLTLSGWPTSVSGGFWPGR